MNKKVSNLDALLLEIKDDQLESFTRFVEATEKLLYRYLAKKIKNTETIQDVMQATYLQVLNLRFRYNPKYAALQWLYVIARSQSRDFWKKEQTQNKIAETLQREPLESQNQEEKPKSDWLELLTQCTEEERDLLERKFVQDQTYQEIAQSLSLSEATLRKRLSRLLRRLALLLPKETRS